MRIFSFHLEDSILKNTNKVQTCLVIGIVADLTYVISKHTIFFLFIIYLLHIIFMILDKFIYSTLE